MISKLKKIINRNRKMIFYKKKNEYKIPLPNLICGNKENLEQLLIDSFELYAFSNQVSKKNDCITIYEPKIDEYMKKYSLNLMQTCENLNKIKIYSLLSRVEEQRKDYY